jgi:SnoaL-like domain
MAPRRLAPALALAVALGAAGCGGDSSSGHRKATARPPSASGHPGSHPAKQSDITVIRGWADTLRAGHVAAAAAYFAVPSIVENATPPIRLRTRVQVRAFNGLLPCGAKLERTFAAGRYVAAVFKLTDRPGGHCGSGAGQEAATAFVIRGGKIAEWRRVPLPSEGAPPQPAPSQPKPEIRSS